MKLSHIFWLIAGLLPSARLSAVFYQAEIYRNPEGNISCLVKDIHVSADNPNFGGQQLNEFNDLVIAYKHSAIAIIEAMNHHTPGDPEAKKLLERHPEPYLDFSADILNYLFLALKDHDGLALNVDYRVLGNRSNKCEQFASGFVLAEFDRIFNLVKKYNDTPEHLKYYKWVLRQVQKGRCALEKKMCSLDKKAHTKSFGVLANKIKDKHIKEEFFDQCNNFDWNLIDARIVHELFVHRDKEIVFVFAGGDHIDAISGDLLEFGYKHLKTIGTEALSEETIMNVSIVLSNSIFKTQVLADYLSELMQTKRKKVAALEGQPPAKKQKVELIAKKPAAAAAATCFADDSVYAVAAGQGSGAPHIAHKLDTLQAKQYAEKECAKARQDDKPTAVGAAMSTAAQALYNHAATQWQVVHSKAHTARNEVGSLAQSNAYQEALAACQRACILLGIK